MAESTWDEKVVLDRGHLNGYTGGDRELAKQVLEIFADNAPGYLDVLSAADCDNWRSAAHKLKGAARGIGAWRLARAAERAELMGVAGLGDPKREAVLSELQVRLEELLVEIKS
ncbi:MAG: Hpt domain-containing protein [Alphaproteobacteria bacterium]|nr:Hpt domain-containing protein [Alphaproteobacteria bacterium]